MPHLCSDIFVLTPLTCPRSCCFKAGIPRCSTDCRSTPRPVPPSNLSSLLRRLLIPPPPPPPRADRQADGSGGVLDLSSAVFGSGSNRIRTQPKLRLSDVCPEKLHRATGVREDFGEVWAFQQSAVNLQNTFNVQSCPVQLYSWSAFCQHKVSEVLHGAQKNTKLVKHNNKTNTLYKTH